MMRCSGCGYEADRGNGDWTYSTQEALVEPAIVVVECPECGGMVDTHVDLR